MEGGRMGWVGRGWGGMMWVWGTPGVYGNFWGVSGNFPGNFQEISGKFPKIVGVIRGVQHDTTQRQIKILTHGLDQNDPTIMLNSPVQYLKNFIFTPN